jgi:hypothetical protein
VCCPGCRSCGVMESPTVLFWLRVILVFRDIIYVIINFIHDIWLSVNTFGPCVEQFILGLTYDEYSILAQK